MATKNRTTRLWPTFWPTLEVSVIATLERELVVGAVGAALAGGGRA